MAKEETLMHFILHKDIRQNEVIRCLLICYLSCLTLFLLLSPLHEHWGMGLWPQDLAREVLGLPEQYIGPKSTEDLLVDVHVKLFLHTITGLTLSVIASRTRLVYVRTIMVVLFLTPVLECLFLLALANLSAGWAYPKFSCYALLWLTQMGLAAYLLNFVRVRP